jgi:peptidoglycan/xylan/chitin deacetylase (PgdA/CDA1 family)
VWSLGQRARPPGVYFLLYHKVSGELPIGIDLPRAVFRRQLVHLHRTGRVVAYDAALATLEAGRPPARDLFVLTFDDGYRDFYTDAFPLLQALRLPATLFVTTRFVEDGVPCVMREPPARPVRPVTWAMLREMHTSGLVTLAAHTHTHGTLPGQSPARVLDELVRPRALIEERVGAPVRHFASPRGAWDETVETHVRRIYASAAVAGWSKETAEGFDRYRIRRLPVLRRDGSLYFRAKVRGWLEQEERALHHQRLRAAAGPRVAASRR